MREKGGMQHAARYGQKQSAGKNRASASKTLANQAFLREFVTQGERVGFELFSDAEDHTEQAPCAYCTDPQVAQLYRQHYRLLGCTAANARGREKTCVKHNK